MERDVIIIGGGVAGLSAGRWCAGLGLRVVLLERAGEAGGQLWWVFNPINNYLGVMAKNGGELRDLIWRQVENSGLEMKLETEVRAVDLEGKSVELGDGEILTAKALIIATGIRRTKLNVPGEEKFAGRGILVSGARDKELARDKDVCIVGGGDAALENALMLADAARSVTIVRRSDRFRARPGFIEKVESDPKIKIISNAVVEEIDGNEKVEAVKVFSARSNESFLLPAQAVLIRIGVEPNTGLFAGRIELDENGFIAVNEKCETSVAGVYAVGDVASPDSMTISTAAGMGATAAHVILKKVSGET
jgi:thioredoxin reductase (NADPH)